MKRPVKVKHILHVSKIAHNLDSIPGLPGDGDIVQFPKDSFVIRGLRYIVGIGMRMDRMYTVYLKRL